MSKQLKKFLEEQKAAGHLHDDDPYVVEGEVRISEVVAKEEMLADAARATIREEGPKLKTSLKLRKLLEKEQLGGNLLDDDPLVCEVRARIAQLKKEEDV